MGNSLGMCAGDRRRSYSFDEENDGAPADGDARHGQQHKKQQQKEQSDDKHDLDDGYEERMQIDDEELAARYRHCMQLDRARRKSTGSMRQRQSCGSRGVRIVTFRAESFDSQVSTESERIKFITQLIDSLPETFVDELEHSTASKTMQVSAQVNHYEVDETDQVFAASTSSVQAGAMLSDSVQSHTYESIKSMDPEAPATSPPPPPSPPPSAKAGQSTSKKQTRKRSTERARQLNGDSHTRNSKLAADAQRSQ